MSTSHKCAAPGCSETVSGTHVACVTHWKLLSKEDRHEISKRILGWNSPGAAREYAANRLCKIEGLL